MKITSDLFHAYLKCPTKCRLRATGEPAAGNTYSEWVTAKNESYRTTEQSRVAGAFTNNLAIVSPNLEVLKTNNWRIAIDLVTYVQVDAYILESELHAIELSPSKGRGEPRHLIPIRFTFSNKLSKDDKLLLAFDALALAQLLGSEINCGKIIHGDDHATLKLNTSVLAGEVRKHIQKMAELLASPMPPELVLNRHCAECEFHFRCRNEATQQDDLSLLSGMTATVRKKLNSKGTFTVKQLSFAFLPRRRPKMLRDKREKYHHSLKARAIREKKLHIVGRPELKIEGTPVFFDVEGVPDRDFYYLIGLRFSNGESVVQHSLWSDNSEGEARSYFQFLDILKTIEKPHLIHYGSFELAAHSPGHHPQCGRGGRGTRGDPLPRSGDQRVTAAGSR